MRLHHKELRTHNCLRMRRPPISSNALTSHNSSLLSSNLNISVASIRVGPEGLLYESSLQRGSNDFIFEHKDSVSTRSELHLHAYQTKRYGGQDAGINNNISQQTSQNHHSRCAMKALRYYLIPFFISHISYDFYGSLPHDCQYRSGAVMTGRPE